MLISSWQHEIPLSVWALVGWRENQFINQAVRSERWSKQSWGPFCYADVLKLQNPTPDRKCSELLGLMVEVKSK